MNHFDRYFEVFYNTRDDSQRPKSTTHTPTKSDHRSR